MATIAAEPGLYEAAWKQVMIDLRAYLGVVQSWIETLSETEKVVGLCVFVVVLMILIVNRSRRKRDPGSNGRQFTGALVLVVIFAFGAGFTVDTSGGSLSHLFGR